MDIFVFNACFYFENAESVEPKYSFSMDVWDNWRDVNSELNFDDCNNPFCSGLAVWNKIYRTDFLKLKRLEFLKYNPFEDFLFCLQAFLQAETIKISPEAYYIYNQTNSNSLTKNYTDNVFQIFNVIDAIQKDRQPYVDAYAGRNALELVLAIYKSQKEGRAVKLPLDDFASVDMTGEF